MKTNLIKNGLAGRYKILVRKEDGSVKQETAWFDNLITDAGINRMGHGGVGTQAYVGSSSTPANVVDVALQSLVASTSSVINDVAGNTNVSPYYGWARRTFRFATGVATGNLSEVGVGWGAGLFSRAIIVDLAGNPTTITVLSDESLDVIYELRLYPPLADNTFTCDISGVTYTCVRRASRVTSESWAPINIFGAGILGLYYITAFNGVIGSITTAPNGSTYSKNSAGFGVYTDYTYNITIPLEFGLTEGNVSGGISALELTQSGGSQTGGSFQISFSPAIPKDATKTLNLTFQISWARHAV